MKRFLTLLLALMLTASVSLAQDADSFLVSDESEVSSRILIAYYTWADNTHVEDLDASLQSAMEHYGNMGDADAYGLDATSSASLVAPGNTAIMAGFIHDIVGGDLFSIQVAEPYPSNYDDCMDRAADELADGARPALKTHVDDMAQYDIVFLGMPNWWYSCPRAILTFVESYDFTGKTVIPFVAHGTGGISGSVRDMSEGLPQDCTVLDPIGVYRPDILTCQPRIEEWLSSMGIEWPAPVSQTALRIRLTVDENTYEAILEDNAATRDLVARLPLTVTFEDYNATEKIAYLTEPLDTGDAPTGCDPDVGTLAYYAPWGNLSLFYQDFRQSDGLVPLGQLETGSEELGAMTEDFLVTITLAE